MTFDGDARANGLGLDETDIIVTFEEAQISTENGSVFMSHIFKGRTFKYKAEISNGRALFTFDRYMGNHVLREEVEKSIWDEYREYIRSEDLNPRGHTCVTPEVVELEVKLQHAQDWWSKIWEISCDLDRLERINVFSKGLDLTSGFRFPRDLLKKLGKHEDGDLVQVNPDSLQKISRVLSMNFERIRSFGSREMEILVAAIYSSTGYFDRVILTPRSRDKGRDVILERDVWNNRRFLIEVKAYSPRRSTPPDKIDAILGVAEGEAPGSCVALFSSSYFSSEIEKRPNIKNTIRKKLQLVDFIGLVEASIQASYSNCPDVLSELRKMTIERITGREVTR